ncbi:class I SAM-dependent methyltransferase [Pinisolibacter sp.]|uniref:class I SAM-dependent methyltransferase n=1 Tax=Pinisolibacter sp. TaxID=2172024 RepID=UPI002FDE9DEC
MDWTNTIDRPPNENLARVSGATTFERFVSAGRGIARTVNAHIDEFLGGRSDLKVLDFGCGCGRVGLPMFFDHGKLTHACDIDASATAYLGRVLPDVDVRTTSFKPPLPYDDDTFDVVYSISIWTHLLEADQLAWLAEMRRIIRPGGYLMATTSSYKAIEHRKVAMKIPAWQDVDPETLRTAGILYRESATLKSHADKYFPGVTDSYGQTSNDPAYLINKWSDYFVFKRHLINNIGGVQDMNILLNAK